MSNEEASHQDILSAEERTALEQIALGATPFSQRAQALIAVSDGADLEEAGSLAGLTGNQVRYWLGRFGTRRLSIFPEEILAVQEWEEETYVKPPILDAAEAELLLEAPEEAPLLRAPEVAGELPEITEDVPEAAIAAAAAGGAMAMAGTTAAVTSKKKKEKKDKKNSTAKKNKKAKDNKKSKKDQKVKEAKKAKKAKKAKEGKKAKEAKKGDSAKKKKKSKKDKKGKKKS